MSGPGPDLLPATGPALALAAGGLGAIVLGGLASLRASRPAIVAAWLGLAEVGFVLLAFAAGAPRATDLALHALAATAPAAGAVLLVARTPGGLRGRPAAALVLAGIGLLSLAGLPPAGGFLARMRALAALVAAGYPVLALLAACLGFLGLAGAVRVVLGVGPDRAARPRFAAVLAAAALAAAAVGSGLWWLSPIWTVGGPGR